MSRHIVRIGGEAFSQITEMALHARRTPTEIVERAILEMHMRREADMRLSRKLREDEERFLASRGQR